MGEFIGGLIASAEAADHIGQGILGAFKLTALHRLLNRCGNLLIHSADGGHSAFVRFHHAAEDHHFGKKLFLRQPAALGGKVEGFKGLGILEFGAEFSGGHSLHGDVSAAYLNLQRGELIQKTVHTFF